MAHELNNEIEHQKVKELRDQGHTVYSISRINSFNTCRYGYFNTYVKKDRGLSSVYGEIGSWIHDYLEKSYLGEITNHSDFKRKLNAELFKMDVKGLEFPNEKIEKSYMADLNHFCDNFVKLNGEFQLEKAYTAKFGEYYMMGYIDVIREYDDKVDIIDFKTSSKFAGAKKLEDAGRQLIVYKLGLEQSGFKIDKVMWNMLKYTYVCWVQKNKKIKRKMVNRGKLIKEMRTNFLKHLTANGYSGDDALLIVDKAELLNDFDSLPQCIHDEFWLEDCLLEYEVTDERVEEVNNYVINTIREIEGMDTEDERSWKPLDIDKDNFYCNTLCSHRNNCEYLADWKRKNPFKKIGF